MRIDTASFEWSVFLRRLPTEPYREGLTEQEAHDFLDEWTAGGGWGESFYLARRIVGPWEFVEGDEPFGAPVLLRRPLRPAP